MPIYVKTDAGPGYDTPVEHDGWLAMDDLHWKVFRKMDRAPGSEMLREDAAAHISDIVLARESETFTAPVFQYLKSHPPGDRLVIHCVMRAGDADILYYLDNPTLTYSRSDPGGRMMEILTLVCRRLDIKCMPRDDQDRPIIPYVAGYDLVLGQTS